MALDIVGKKIGFKSGTQKEIEAISNKEDNVFYAASDTNEVFLGSRNLSKPFDYGETTVTLENEDHYDVILPSSTTTVTVVGSEAGSGYFKIFVGSAFEELDPKGASFTYPTDLTPSLASLWEKGAEVIIISHFEKVGGQGGIITVTNSDGLVPMVNQSYSPTSEKAQSGKAVNEAIHGSNAVFNFRITYSDNTVKEIEVLGKDVTPSA